MNLNVFLFRALLSSSSLAFFLSCKQTDFQGAEKRPTPPSSTKSKQPPAVSTEKPTGSFESSASANLSCDQEQSGKTSVSPQSIQLLNIQKNCATQSQAIKRPADIVFVIDVTSSMQGSLDAVKNGVERFARQLRQDKGWDARFAAIGFRDEVQRPIVPFTDEKSLSNVVSGWFADGGEDPQEAGQSGLAAAIALLTQDLSSTPQRSNADKIILFIGDAIGFALNGNHNDFSTSELEKVFNSAPTALKGKLKFYHSTAATIPICELQTPFGCLRLSANSTLAANGQIKAFAKKMNLPGRGFDFPFTESILLSEFIDEFVPSQACVLSSAIARNSDGKELSRTDDSGALQIPQPFRGQPIQLEINRCCVQGPTTKPTNSSCQTKKISVGVDFPK